MASWVYDERVWVHSQLVAIAAAVLISVPPAVAQPSADSAPLVDAEMKVDALRMGAYVVGFHAGRGRTTAPGAAQVCADAGRVVVDRHRKTRYSEVTCTMAEGFRFDAAGWTAGIDDTFESHLYVERFQRKGASWRRVSATQSTRTITARLRWTGAGEERSAQHVYPPGVGSCYSLLPCVRPPWVSIERERRALVSGTLRFEGLGLTVRIPSSHGGTMRWAS